MPKVHLLDKELAELIAAGEVIERPSSVIKELVENSIDSGASAITVEIKQGGISYIRITDNGCGMSYEDVPTAFLRHATSKIGSRDDLMRIMTLGFRGEALASICAVAKCEVMTKPKEDEYGVHYVIEGTEEKVYEKAGCPDGTTIMIRDIFYNVPARLKFLKQDKYEGNAIAAIVSKIAVSHPEISFRFIRNNRQELFTPGDSRLYSAIYSVMGKEFAASLIPVDYSVGGISVSGYTVKPLWGKKNRTMQHFFINGRYVKSLTCMSALEEAYRNSLMEGKFPACVLFMNVNPASVDVNVHPAKTEVRFSDDKVIYDALYFAVKNALLADEKPAEIKIPQRQKTEADYAMPMFTDMPKAEQTVISDTSKSRYAGVVKPAAQIEQDKTAYREQLKRVQQGDAHHHAIRVEEIPKEFIPANREKRDNRSDEDVLAQAVAAAESAWQKGESEPKKMNEACEINSEPEESCEQSDVSEHLQGMYGDAAENGSIDKLEPAPKQEFKFINESVLTKNEPKQTEIQQTEPEEKKEIYFRLIGEAFKNYVIAETEDGLLIVDKHAAHERINFERLRTGRENLTAQLLLCPEKLRLDYEEYDAVVKNLKVCTDCGFEIEPLEAPEVMIKGIPSMLDKNNACDIVTELAQNFARHRHDPLPEILDDMYHTMACRSAIKANDLNSLEELKGLVEQILADERIRYCPHGRPVMFRLTKRELEKQFRRIV